MQKNGMHGTNFRLLNKKLPENFEKVDVYGLADLHIGSENTNEMAMMRWRKDVIDNENALVILGGDLVDNALKNSKTNSYSVKMTPREEKLALRNFLEPIRDKIVLAVQGNHEYRSTYLTDDCPLYDVLAKLDLEDVYSDDIGFIKINFGKKNLERQYSYSIACVHGTSENKEKIFGYAMEGVDVLFSGHTHKPKSTFPSKIVVDKSNEVVRMQDFYTIVLPSFQTFGGYVAKGMYMPSNGRVYPVVSLYGCAEKRVEVLWK